MGRKPSPPDKDPTPHWSISGLILGGLCVCAAEWVIAYSVTGGHPAKLIPTFFIVMFLLLVIVRFTNVTDKHFPEAPPSDSQPGMEASSSGQPPPTTRLLFTSSPFWDRVLLMCSESSASFCGRTPKAMSPATSSERFFLCPSYWPSSIRCSFSP